MMLTAHYLKRMWSFARALDLALVDEEFERGFQFQIGRQHGERVAYISLCLGKMMGLRQEDLFHLTVAGLLHDIGAIAEFRQCHGAPQRMREHSLVGAKMVENFPAGEILAPAIRYHHEAPVREHGVTGVDAQEVPLFARILALADHLDIMMERRVQTYAERERLIRWVKENSGRLVFPEVAQVFTKVAGREAFWLNLEQPDLPNIVLGQLELKGISLSNWEWDRGFTVLLAEMFAGLVDQKSQFTARHSHAVAETVQELAAALSWDKEKQREIYLAGLLHDLGKLAVPNKILDKPGKLELEELEIIRTHSYYTHRLLTEAGFPAELVEWAAYHHERMDGLGYPFGFTANDLTIGSRLMTIADIFAALTEERPYREALSAGKALEILAKGAGTGVDAELLQLAGQVLG
ncbi:HD-GYP domain-containing protein [Paradesulfitobacterium ferrireducens]|uniref:HD-GYP domain-containing protein n=1 Tax=Paradesulfitobacterium ferrireducens TaxID=2816476 RepID=UPI001A8F21AD|nr:HD-GYP domain-containing protein [Paradesulfitobacterium ferrireducens]